MKRFICSLLFGSVLCHTGLAGPLPLWQNFGLITDAPTINALAFDNRGEIDLTNTTEIPYVIPYVYETQNTRYFTNRGVMTGTRGFQFDTVRSGKLGMERVPAQVFINSNNGRITGVDGDYSNYGADPIISSCVRVLATNVTNSGEISVGDLGFMQIIGKNVDLSRGALEAGTLSSAVNNTMTHGGYVGTNFNLFVNPYAVQDIYGYVGTSNVWLQSLMTTYGTGNYQAWAYTNMGTTNTYINIVFVQNNTAANFTTDVRFCGTSGADVPANDYDHYATEAIVSIGSVVKDVVTGATATSAFYVLDTGAAQTNYSLLTNDWTVAYIPTFRPSPFQIATALPVEWNSGVSSNLGYTADLIYPGLIASNSYASNLVTGSYAGYSAQVGPSTNVGSVFGNPTNQSAHIEISGDRLNLSNARIRAEGLLGIKAKHLVAQSPVAIDAGNMNLDFGSTNGFLSVSNILPSTFSRSRGSVSCYGFNWVNFTTNALGTHYYKFHVLVVDHDIQPPASPHIRDLALRATSVYAQDTLSVNQSALFDCEKLTLNGNVSLEGKAGVFNDSVAPKLKSLLIDANGVLDANQLNLGIERGDGFVSFTNRGRVSAQVVQIKASLMENSGYLQSHYFVSLNVQAPVSNNFVRNPDAGTLVLTTNKNGKPSQIYSDSDCEISARVLRANNADISSGMAGSGALTLNVSHELSDGIVAASGTNNVIKNFWYLNNGFQLSQKPAIGDLFGTRITASGDNNYPIFAWAGEDRGRGVAGFSNNVVIGHLELFCNNADSVLEFKGTGNHNAMYVDFLGFQGRNTNYDQWLLIDPNLVIYFADSNIDPTSLTTAFPGQLVWASEFAGPNSSTNVQAHVGGVLTNIYANRWLATSKSAPFPFDGTFLLATASSGGTISPSLNGKSLLIGTNYTLHAVPDRGYVFRSWVISNSTAVVTSSLPSLTFAMQSNLVIQAQFVFDPSYLRVTICGAGKVTPDLTSNSLAFGTTYQLTATPTAGNVFAGWSGGVTNTNATLSFIMRSNLTIKANFVTNDLRVMISGAGKVTPNLMGTTMVFGKTYQLTATPAVGNVFAGWSGGVTNSNATLSFIMRSNLTIRANFVTNQLPNLKGSYSCLFYNMDRGITNVTLENSGALSFVLTDTGAASGKITMAGGVYNFTAKFGVGGTSQVAVSRSGGLSNLNVMISISSDGDCTTVGTVTDGRTFTNELRGFRAAFNASTNPAKAAGYYTFALPGTTNGSGPAGDGYGKVTVTSAGVATFSVNLPDGTNFVQSGSLSQSGHLPFFFTRDGKDLLLSMIRFDTNDNSLPAMTNSFIGFSGKIYWIKKSGAPSPYYKKGFTNQMDFAGSWYKAAVSPTIGLSLSNAVIELIGGDLSTNYSKTVATNAIPFSVSAGKEVTVTNAPATGFFTGQIVIGAKITPLKGVVLQRQNCARGCFYGSTNSGEVWLHNLSGL